MILLPIYNQQVRGRGVGITLEDTISQVAPLYYQSFNKQLSYKKLTSEDELSREHPTFLGSGCQQTSLDKIYREDNILPGYREVVILGELI